MSSRIHWRLRSYDALFLLSFSYGFIALFSGSPTVYNKRFFSPSTPRALHPPLPHPLRTGSEQGWSRSGSTPCTARLRPHGLTHSRRCRVTRQRTCLFRWACDVWPVARSGSHKGGIEYTVDVFMKHVMILMMKQLCVFPWRPKGVTVR